MSKDVVAAPPTYDQEFVNNAANDNAQCYANPITYPMNRSIQVDPNTADTQLRATNSMFWQQGNVA